MQRDSLLSNAERISWSIHPTNIGGYGNYEGVVEVQMNDSLLRVKLIGTYPHVIFSNLKTQITDKLYKYKRSPAVKISYLD